MAINAQLPVEMGEDRWNAHQPPHAARKNERLARALTGSAQNSAFNLSQYKSICSISVHLLGGLTGVYERASATRRVEGMVRKYLAVSISERPKLVSLYGILFRRQNSWVMARARRSLGVGTSGNR